MPNINMETVMEEKERVAGHKKTVGSQETCPTQGSVGGGYIVRQGCVIRI